ncbi:MAG: hypothetical protein ABI120_04795 [Gemmatimonadaceae bacterium]
MNRLLLTLPALLVVAACSSEAPTSSAVADVLTPRLAVSATSTAVFDNIPALLPPNMPSQGYQCCQVAELGDLIELAGTARRASSATVIMSDWAKHSTYPSLPAAGFDHPITLTIYAVNTADANLPGAVLGTITKTFTIPWRPEHDASCPGDAWKAGDGNCYNGLATPITFDLKSLTLVLPDKFIYGIAYNTNTWGYNPIGANGPYESLNVALNTVGPTVGTDVDPDAVFVNYAIAGNYTDGGTGGYNIFRRDTGWSPYSPAVQFTATAVATTAASCKNGGWQALSRVDGTGFSNQGDCVSYVQNGK